MKIHSLSGCACHNTIRALPSDQLDVAYSILKFDGHTYECEHHPTQPREDVQTKDPAKVCCQSCAGQGYLAMPMGHMITCGCSNGQALEGARLMLAGWLRHDQNLNWRNWRHDRNDLRMDAMIKHERRHGNRTLADAWATYYFGRGDTEPLP